MASFPPFRKPKMSFPDEGQAGGNMNPLGDQGGAGGNMPPANISPGGPGGNMPPPSFPPQGGPGGNMPPPNIAPPGGNTPPQNIAPPANGGGFVPRAPTSPADSTIMPVQGGGPVLPPWLPKPPMAPQPPIPGPSAPPGPPPPQIPGRRKPGNGWTRTPQQAGQRQYLYGGTSAGY